MPLRRWDMVLRWAAIAIGVTTAVGCTGSRGALPPLPFQRFESGAQQSRGATILSPFGLPAHASATQLGLPMRPGPAVAVCPPARPDVPRCLSWIRTDVHGLGPNSTPYGYAPADLQTAYNLTPYSRKDGVGTTVAVVDSFDDPNVETDLAAYRKEWGLPPCTTANRCFTKHALTTKTNIKWAAEESLDVDMVSAICPNCHILVVEGTGGAYDSAEQYATSHAHYVSNSWSYGEGYTGYDNDFDVPGVLITAATGDHGYNKVAGWPAILPTVIAVGGTTLLSVSPRAETAWGGAGSGCSAIYKKPNFQKGIDTGCSKRAESDVSAEADPNTGVAIYDTFGTYGGYNGWHLIGGTSASTPMIAALFAMGGCHQTCAAANLYAHASNLNNITIGSNGKCGAPLCVAGKGWNGPTGLGTPNGLAGFAPAQVVLSAPSINLYGTGTSHQRTVTVTQHGNTDAYILAQNCSTGHDPVADIVLEHRAGGTSKYLVVPLHDGSCKATFTGADKEFTVLPIYVGAPGAVTLSLKTMFFWEGQSSNQLVVTQPHYNGTFSMQSNCLVVSDDDKPHRGFTGIATIEQLSNGDGAAVYSVGPLNKAGNCTATFTGDGTSATLTVTVVPKGTITISPASLTITADYTYFVSVRAGPSSDSYHIGVSDPSCAYIAFVSPNSAIQGGEKYTVEPVENTLQDSSCSATFTLNGHSATLPISIVLPTPAPSPTPPGVPLYVSDDTSTAVSQFTSGCTSAACVRLLGDVGNPEGLAVDPSGDVFVSDDDSERIVEIPAGCATASCQVTLAIPFVYPWALAADGTGNVFVTDLSQSTITEIPPHCNSATCTSTFTGFNFALGVAVDGSDNVFVANEGTGQVLELAHGCQSASCASSVGGTFAHPAAVAVDGSDNVFVADLSTNNVSKIPASCFRSSTCTTTIGGGFNQPAGLAVDGSDNVYVADSGNGAVKRIPSGCLTAACIVLLGGGFSNPSDVAVMPNAAALRRQLSWPREKGYRRMR